MRLKAEKRKAQHDGDEEPEVERAAVSGLERVVRDRQRATGRQQDDRIEQRNSHRAHRRELLLEVRADRRPLRRIVGPQHAAGQRVA